MSPDLLALAQNYFLGDTVRQISTTFGESERHVEVALRNALPLALGALLVRAQQPGGATDLFGRVYRMHRRDPLGKFGALLGTLSDPAAPTPATSLDGSLPGPGPGLLRTVLGSSYAQAVEGISRQAGVHPDTMPKLLSLAGAVGLGLLGRYAAQHTLDARGLTGYLGGQAAPIGAALAGLPSSWRSALATLVAIPAPTAYPPAQPQESTAPPVPAPAPQTVPAPQPAPATEPVPTPQPSPEPILAPKPLSAPEPEPTPTPKPPAAPQPRLAPEPVVQPRPAPVPEPTSLPSSVAPKRRLPWVLVLLLVAVLGLAAAQVYFLRSARPKPTAAPPTGSDTVATASRKVPTVPDQPVVVSRPPAYLAGRAALPLVGGRVLRVSNNSAEARLYRFLKAPAQTVSLDKTQGWLILDQVYFLPGKAILTRESLVQLRQLAAILKTFPRATIKLGGYAADQASADKNLLLSADCANMARRVVIAGGVAPGRVAAEGYGQAKTRTPDARSRTHRVYVRVTKK